MRKPGLALLVLTLALAGGWAPAHAAMLEASVCADLKVEHGLLETKGVPAEMAKGPEWGKANLSRERLKEIERLIHVLEQLAFRCPQPKKPPAPGDDDDGTVAATPAKGGKAAQAKATKTAKSAAADPAEEPKPKPRKAPVKAQQPAAADAAAPPEQAKAPPKKAPAKPKPKVEDAYSPAAVSAPGASSTLKSN